MENEVNEVYQKDNLSIYILRTGQNIGELELYFEIDNIDT